MEAYQQRVVEECRELREKLDEINQFVQTVVFDGRPEDERKRLLVQRFYMDEYVQILDERIANFQ